MNKENSCMAIYIYIVYLFVKWKNEADNDGWLLIIVCF